jgi:hypothetical protein
MFTSSRLFLERFGSFWLFLPWFLFLLFYIRNKQQLKRLGKGNVILKRMVIWMMITLITKVHVAEMFFFFLQKHELQSVKELVKQNEPDGMAHNRSSEIGFVFTHHVYRVETSWTNAITSPKYRQLVLSYFGDVYDVAF